MTQLKTIRIDLDSRFSEVELHTFADLHIGDENCDLKAIKKRIEYVKEKDEAFVILNGDLLNNAITTSVSDSYTEKISPMGQIDYCVELFTPIKDKILCITSGNHEQRTYRGAGIDVSEIVAIELGLRHRFTKASAVLFLRFGCTNQRRKQRYSIYVTHGRGGGRRPGGKVNSLSDMSNIVDCDIYLHAHTHLPVLFKEGFHRTNNVTSTVTFVERLFVNTAASLKYGGYGEVQQYTPASMASPVIFLKGTHKEATALL